MPDVSDEEWFQWLEQPGPKFTNVAAEDSAAELIDRFRRSCNVQTLVEIITDEFYITTVGKVVRDHQVQVETAKLRAEGHTVRTEAAPGRAACVSEPEAAARICVTYARCDPSRAARSRLRSTTPAASA
jgi:hypothetical protein